ncbi:MAG: helix-turn-helix domain-containing protein [Pseudomonadota bacterium]
MIETADLIIRSSTLGVGILLIAHFASIRPVSRKTVSAITKIIAVLSMVVVSSLLFMELGKDSASFQLTVRIIMALNAPMIAWGLLELFEDDFQPQWWQIAFVAASLPSHFLIGIHPVFGLICHVSSMIIYSYIFYVALTTRHDDLVQARCMFRMWFMSSAAIAGITFSGLHWYYGDFGLTASFHVFKASVLLILCIIFAYWALKVREYVWAMPHREKKTAPENLSPAELSLLTRLQASMEEDVWRQEGLTIRKLAEALSAPEHRLRKVINQGMGYRNFAHFVNEHRIGAACEVLADPIKADIPIISIAYDVGYASLGPFNRAFREIVGESPTEFRKRSFAHA